ncbi:MAG: hypothetical protein CM15mP74_00020 [Halieaceae bacterium]|nr:MAG: hypothetical protein CM15mP74_00020 [Halieaceae bacterium]
MPAVARGYGYMMESPLPAPLRRFPGRKSMVVPRGNPEGTDCPLPGRLMRGRPGAVPKHGNTSYNLANLGPPGRRSFSAGGGRSVANGAAIGSRLKGVCPPAGALKNLGLAPGDRGRCWH